MMQKKKTVGEVSPATFAGKRVLVRVDFNVPQDGGGSITDDSRIKAVLPTIELLRRAGAKVILASHLGRPKGKTEKFTLKPVAQRLGELLGVETKQLPDCVGDEVKNFVGGMKNGDVCLLENVRFHEAEEK